MPLRILPAVVAWAAVGCGAEIGLIQDDGVPVCGNGLVDEGELCDDANDDDTDACTSACVEARCGDGFVQAGVEACDDGNDDDTDSCRDTCELARCGDGVVQAGVDGCDEGDENGSEGTTCLADCTPVAFGAERSDHPIDPMRGDMQEPDGLQVGDFDGDGAPDLLVSVDRYEEDVFSYQPVLRMMNDRAGTFWPPYADRERLGTGRVHLADLDRDGRQDAMLTVTGSDNPDSLARYEGTPEGLERGVVVDIGADSGTPQFGSYGPRQVALVDFLDNGQIDAVTVNQSDTADLSVLLNNGLGGLNSFRQLSLPAGDATVWAEDIVVRDVTGNGELDLVTTDIQNDRVVLFEGIDRAVDFEDPVFIDLADSVFALSSFDADQDGTVEIVVWLAGDVGPVVVDWDGKGLVDGGAFDLTACPVSFVTPAVGDVDGDGREDLLVDCEGDLGVVTHGKPGAPVFTPIACADCGQRVFAQAQTAQLALADADGDNALDALVVWSDADVAVFWNDTGTPGGTPTRLFADNLDSFSLFGLGIGAGDVTGDGVPDLVGSSVSGPYVLPGLGGRRFANAGGVLTTAPRRVTAVGNLNDDGPDDALLVGTSFRPDFPTQSASMIAWGFSAGTRPLVSSANVDIVDNTFNEPGHDVTGLALGDLDGDDVADAVWVSDFDDVYVFYMGVGDNTLGFSDFLDTPSPGTTGVVLADHDGDQVLDLFGLDPGAGLVDAREGNGDGSFGLPTFPDVGGKGSEAADLEVVDVSGDGLADLVVLDPSADTWSVALATGPFAWAAPVARTLGQSPVALDAGDANGDGVVDVAVVGADGVDLYLGVGEGAFAAPIRLAVGNEPADVRLVDVNADDRDDVVTVNRGSDDVTVLK